MKALLKKTSTSEPFSFSFIDEEGKTVLKSENYKAKDSAAKGIRAVKKNCTEDKRLVLKKSTDGKFFFNVKSANGQIVATSAMYATEEDRKNAISYNRTRIPECPIEEQSL